MAATWVTPNPYPLHVRECWAGLVRAVQEGLYDPEHFDKVRSLVLLLESRLLRKVSWSVP